MFSLIENNNQEFKSTYLLAYLSDEAFVFNINNIIEVTTAFQIQHIDTDTSKLAYITYKGENIYIYDLKKYFGLSNATFNENSQFLILQVHNVKFAIIIDSTGEIISINDDEFSKFDKTHDNLDFISICNFSEKTIKKIDVNGLHNYIQNNTSFFAITENNLHIIASNNTKINYLHSNLLKNNTTFEIFNDKFFNEKFILFKLENEIYSFGIEYVKEIKKIQYSNITKVPCVPDFILGILNFRGNYISVIDIKTFLNIKRTDYSSKVSVITLKINDLKIAIVVDEVLDIINLPIAKMNPSENDEESFVIGEIKYQEDKFVNLLNVEKLFSSENVNIEYYE